MIRHGEAPFLECSSRGDRRFSAFYARVAAYGDRTIEEIYQGAKVFDDGATDLPVRKAKGRRACNMDEVAKLYRRLWKRYLKENPDLMPILITAKGLSDIFGQEGHMCQATELWRLRRKAIKKARKAVRKSGG